MRTFAGLSAAVLISGCGSAEKADAPRPGDAEPPRNTAAATAAASAAPPPPPTDVDEGRVGAGVPTVQPVRAPTRGLGGGAGNDKPGGRLEPERPTPMGAHVAAGSALAEEDVRRTVEAGFSGFDKCVAHVGGSAKGSVSVRLAIQPEGSVTEAAVLKSSFRVAKFDDCVAGVTKALRFPKAQQSSSFVVPIEFDR